MTLVLEVHKLVLRYFKNTKDYTLKENEFLIKVDKQEYVLKLKRDYQPFFEQVLNMLAVARALQFDRVHADPQQGVPGDQEGDRPPGPAGELLLSGGALFKNSNASPTLKASSRTSPSPAPTCPAQSSTTTIHKPSVSTKVIKLQRQRFNTTRRNAIE